MLIFTPPPQGSTGRDGDQGPIGNTVSYYITV